MGHPPVTPTGGTLLDVVRLPCAGLLLALGVFGYPLAAAMDGTLADAHGGQGFGREVGGLRARVVLPASSYRLGVSIVPAFEIRNVSDVSVSVWEASFWPNHRLTVTDDIGAELALTALGERARELFSPAGPRRKNLAVIIPPGGVHAVTVPSGLTELFVLDRPGTYRVSVEYEECPETWSGHLVPPPVEFQIVTAD